MMPDRYATERSTEGRFNLCPDHIAAVNKKRRIVVNHPADGLLAAIERGVSINDLMTYELAFTDEPGCQIDGQWWSLDSLFPMKVRPMTARDSDLAKGRYLGGNIETIYKWADEGINIARVYVEQTKKRGLECFYSYRISSGTSHLEFGKDFLAAHQDWLVEDEWSIKKWNFAMPEVRAAKLSLLQELSEDYDLDGLELDLARGASNLPAGRQWEHRDEMTQFMHDVRGMTLAVERERGRPLLVAARVPDMIVGCHFDGLDVETWIDMNLIDILVLGVRSYELDIERFSYLIGKKPIQLLATLDDHHCTDGYSWPPIEVLRGVAANWWQQGIDGLQTFNWGTAPPDVAASTGMFVRQAYADGSPRIHVYQRAYHELGSTETLQYKNKTFVVQRRGGGGSGGADIDDWRTPRFAYQNTNMLGQLPATLDRTGKVDTLVRLRVGDDLAAHAAMIESITLRVLLSDPSTERLPEDEKIEKVSINPFWGNDSLFTSPVRKGMEDHIEVRLNGILLVNPEVRDGWFAFDPDANLFAIGENLIGIVVTERDVAGASLMVEKVEVQVRYRER